MPNEDVQFPLPAASTGYDFSGTSASLIPDSRHDPAQGRADGTFLTENGALVLPVSGGRAVGVPFFTAVKVPVAQIRVDPRNTTRPNFGTNLDHRKGDKAFEQLCKSILQSQGNVDPVICSMSDDYTTVLGEQVPYLDLRVGTRRYWAIKEDELPEILVRIVPANMSVGEQVLLGLIQNETQQPMSILDKSDAIATLVDVNHLLQKVIAARLGVHQSTISRYYNASHQGVRIRRYLANGSLSLDTVTMLIEKIKEDELRETAAMYLVQEVMSGAKAETFIENQLCPKGIAASVALVRQDDDYIQRMEIQGVATYTATPRTSAGPVKEDHYWTRGTPLKASPVRLLNNSHQVGLQGTSDQPEVLLQGLQGQVFFDRAEREGWTTVLVEALEEAYLADLEAITAALRMLKERSNEGGKGTVDSAPGSPIRLQRAAG